MLSIHSPMATPSLPWEAFNQRGLVSESDSGKWDAMARLITDWSAESPAADHQTAILAGGNAEVTALNRMAQSSRRQSGRLGASHVPVGIDTFFQGDRVLFTRNSMALSVMNGDRGTVRQIRGGVLRIDLDSGSTVEVQPEFYPHLRLGYAMTTHKAQGMTVERAFIVVGDSMVNREMAYVQASRARGDTRWYIADELHETARQMAHSRQKEMASALLMPTLELALQR